MAPFYVKSLVTNIPWNTSSLEWSCLQRFTQYLAEHQEPLEPLPATCCTGEPHCCLVRSIPNCQRWKPVQPWWAPNCNCHLKRCLIFESTKCRCGKIVDELKLHGFSCTKHIGHFFRHSAINYILKRSLTCINLPSTLEHVGLTRDKKRPNGFILGLWH